MASIHDARNVPLSRLGQGTYLGVLGARANRATHRRFGSIGTAKSNLTDCNGDRVPIGGPGTEAACRTKRPESTPELHRRPAPVCEHRKSRRWMTQVGWHARRDDGGIPRKDVLRQDTSLPGAQKALDGEPSFVRRQRSWEPEDPAGITE